MSASEVQDLADVRAAFDRAGYTADGVAALLGEDAGAALARQESVPARRACRDRTPATALVRLFLLQDAVPHAEAASALPVPAAQRLGFLARDGEEVRARLDVRPHDTDLYVVADLGNGLDGALRPLPADHVLGVGGASVSLAELAVRDPVQRALDLGTGCGVQALHLARHARQVVATDLLPRALHLARLGAGLSGITLDLRAGDGFEPVTGERFDLVVSNPPFAVGGGRPGSPGYRAYRDGGLDGDGTSRRLVAGAAAHLAPGGWFQQLGNWVHRRGEDWRDRVAGWLPAGCDGWVVQRDVLDPAAYVSLWLQDAGDAGGPLYRERYDAWLTTLEEAGVEAVGLGWVTLRRADAADPLRRVEAWPHPVEAPPGPHVAAAFARWDWLRERPDPTGFLAERLVLAPDVVQEQIGAPGAEHPERVVLRQQRGFRRARAVDTATAAVVGACQGDTPLSVLVDAAAEVLGEPPGMLRTTLVPALRELCAEGYLTPPGVR